MAQTVTARRTRSLNLGGTAHQRTQEVTVNDPRRQPIAVEIPDASTDFEVSVSFLLAKLKGYILKSDRAITIETNDGTTPGDTIAMAAGQEREWLLGDDIAGVFTDDVTKLFITNASGGVATLTGEFLDDATPST